MGGAGEGERGEGGEPVLSVVKATFFSLHSQEHILVDAGVTNMKSI